MSVFLIEVIMIRRPCLIFVAGTIVMVASVVIFLLSPSMRERWCPGGIAVWSDRNYTYYDQKRVGSYGCVAALQRVVPTQRDVERWLSTQDAYTFHRPVRRRFKRRSVVVGGPNQQWQADLVDMSRLKRPNDETKFLLTVIDVFSKRAWCIPLKSKSAEALVAAFRPLLNNRAPTALQTDKGSEFFNWPLQRLLKEYGVHHFMKHNEETKASIVNSYHRSIGMAPSAVNNANQEMV